jgi:ATP-dependent DNA helicase DinG
VSVERLFLPEAAAALRGAIAEAGGNEVRAIGSLDPEGRVERITVGARGNAEAVPALEAHLGRGDVVVHNHPGGRLEPSTPDFAVASRLGAQGIGFYIVDNQVARVYVVAEPIQVRPLAMLDPGRLSGLLRAGGGLAAVYPDFEERASQVRMLEFVAEGFNREELRSAEAGTGVGKSLAYLIPAFQWALENGERVVISTATINLQQQLVDKDIPLVVRLLGRDPGHYLVKGRGTTFAAPSAGSRGDLPVRGGRAAGGPGRHRRLGPHHPYGFPHGAHRLSRRGAVVPGQFGGGRLPRAALPQPGGLLRAEGPPGSRRRPRPGGQPPPAFRGPEPAPGRHRI